MSNNYENSPACKMLATRCAVCARKLVDAVSVDLGIGPDCRAKYGFDEGSDALREHANALVHKIAVVQKGQEAFAACKELHDIGFQKLAARIMERLTAILVTPAGEDRLVVRTPYSFTFTDAVKRIPGRQWNKQEKAWFIPATLEARVALKVALEKSFAGRWARGPKGPFVIAHRAGTLVFA